MGGVTRFVCRGLLTTALSLAAMPVPVQTSRYPSLRRDTWYEFLLKKFNPTDFDYGAWLEQRRKALLESTVREPRFWYSLSATTALMLSGAPDPAAGYPSTLGYDHVVSIDKKSDTQTVWHFGPETTKSAKDSTGAATYRCGLTAPLNSGIYAPYLLIGMQVYPKVALANIPHADWAKSDFFNVKPTVTTGPYMVESFTPGNAAQVVMVPNAHYADGRSSAKVFNHAPYLDKVIYKIYGTKPSQIAGLAAGDTDLGLDLIAKDLPDLQSISGYHTVAITGLLDEFLTFNQGKNMKGCPAPYDQTKCGTNTIFVGDKVLRQAINLAIDRQELVLGDHGLRHRAFGHLLQLPSSNTVLPGRVLMDRLFALKILRCGRRRRRRRRPHPRRQNAIRICTVRRGHLN